MNTAYFKDISSHIQEQLDNAQDEIKIAMAWFTSNELFEALKSCLKRKVSVSLLILDDPINWAPYAPDFNQLIEMGATLKVADSSQGLMHHKFCIIDGTLLINGSYNWTYYAETRNSENVVFSDDKLLIQSFDDEYGKITQPISKKSKTPRMTWQEIADLQLFDFTDLNYESKHIAYNQSLPQIQLQKCGSIVEVKQVEKKARLKYSIGFHAQDNEELKFDTLIDANTILPCEFDIPLECPKEHRANAELRLASSNNVRDEFARLPLNSVFLPLMDSEKPLAFDVKLSISDGGIVYIRVQCPDTNLKAEQSCQIPSLIDYL